MMFNGGGGVGGVIFSQQASNKLLGRIRVSNNLFIDDIFHHHKNYE